MFYSIQRSFDSGKCKEKWNAGNRSCVCCFTDYLQGIIGQHVVDIVTNGHRRMHYTFKENKYVIWF